MGTTRALFLATLAIGASTAASAADLLPPPPPLPLPPAPAPVADFGAWYIRGDVGVGAAQMTEWRSTLQPNSYGELPQGPVVPEYASLGDQTFGGAGVGYQFNNWLRGDLTGEYRTEASYRAVINYALPGVFGSDLYSAGVSSTVFLANGYVDLGCWRGITPFVGAGLGFATNNMRGLNDWGSSNASFGSPGVALAPDRSQTNFAWALMGGLAFNVTPNVKLEVGYRYLDMGGMRSNSLACYDGPDCFYEKQSFHLASHDIRLGFRYLLGEPSHASPPLLPLIAKY